MKLNSCCGFDLQRAAITLMIVPWMILIFLSSLISRALSLHYVINDKEQNIEIYQLDIFFIIFGCVVYASALHGAWNKEPSYLVPYLIFWIIAMAYPVAGLVAVIKGTLTSSIVTNELLITFWIILFGFYMYTLLIVYSYYKQLKGNRFLGSNGQNYKQCASSSAA